MQRSFTSSLVIGVSITLLAIAGVCSYKSPDMAIENVQRAAINHDDRELERLVHFPALRTYYRSVVLAGVRREAEALTEDPDEQFAFMSGADEVIEEEMTAEVTPAKIGRIIRKDVASNGFFNQYHDLRTTYISWNVVRLTLDEGVANSSVLLKRTGLFSWQIVKIEIGAV